MKTMDSRSYQIVSVLFVIMFIVFPFGYMIFSSPTTGEVLSKSLSQIKVTLQAKGINVCGEETSQWNIPGEIGSKTYLLSRDCSSSKAGQTTSVVVISFKNAELANSADKNFDSMKIGSIYPNSKRFIYGTYLVIADGLLIGSKSE